MSPRNKSFSKPSSCTMQGRLGAGSYNGASGGSHAAPDSSPAATTRSAAAEAGQGSADALQPASSSASTTESQEAATKLPATQEVGTLDSEVRQPRAACQIVPLLHVVKADA